MPSGQVHEVAAVDLAGADAGETGTLVGKSFRHAAGGVLMINGAGDWFGLPDRGQQVSRQLYTQLTEFRGEQAAQIAVILTGQADPLLRWLHGSPQLAARFLAVIDFPGYAPGQLAAVFGKLADEAGLRLTVAARRKAAAVIEQAEHNESSGNARLAVRLLNEARAAHAHRVARGPSSDRDRLRTGTWPRSSQSPRPTSRSVCFPMRSAATMTDQARICDLRRRQAGSRFRAR
jgi:hypothetical protein